MMTMFSSPSFAVCLLLLCSLVTVAFGGDDDECVFPADAVPYITFMGNRLPNHSFVSIEEFENGSKQLQCHTDLPSCCQNEDLGEIRQTGEWVLPNGQEVGPTPADYSVKTQAQRLDLCFDGDNGRRPAIGMYRCDIPITAAANNEGGTARETVYVGLYRNDDLYIENVFLTVNSDLNGESPQFTLTCVSTGGPAVCVVWRRQKKIIANPNTTSALVNPATGQYMHNLTVTGNLGGSYSCNVVNDKPANEYEGMNVQTAEPPVFMTAIQEGATIIRVIWFTTNSPRNVIGYRIYYRGPTTDSVEIDDPQANTHLLTGLKNNGSYTIFIVSKSIHLPSERLESEPVNLAPGVPELQLYSTTPDSVSVSWTLTPGSLADRYEINWSRNHTQFASFHDILSSSASNYTVSGLSDYGNATIIITVTAFNAFGSTTSTSMNIAANVATSQVNEGQGRTQNDSSSSDDNDAVIIGVVTVVVVILAITVIAVALIICFYKSKSMKNSKTPVYSLARPRGSGPLSPSAPLPPPPRGIHTHNNRSYSPSAVASDGAAVEQSGLYYTPMAEGYTYPTSPSPPELQPREPNNDNTASAANAGHGYEYISVQK